MKMLPLQNVYIHKFYQILIRNKHTSQYCKKSNDKEILTKFKDPPNDNPCSQGKMNTAMRYSKACEKYLSIDWETECNVYPIYNLELTRTTHCTNFESSY